ncbi:MAG: AMP-dependent synthetase, partial [Spirochaetae bacterium HGW-Spirochaetae-7]
GAVRTAYDYSGLASASRRFAARLGALGIARGDRVMLLCENRPEWAVAYFGIAAAGAVAVPVLVDFLPEQIANVAGHAGIKAVCASEKTAPKLAMIDAALPVLRLDALDDSGTEPSGALPGDSRASDDLACILYTSGTSGNSKGVMLTHGNIVSNVQATAAVFPLRPTDRVLSVMPLAHTLESTMGLLTPIFQGCSIFYLDRPPTAPVLAAALLLVKPTIMVIVPLIIEKLYRAKVEPKLRNHPLYKFAPTRRLAVKAAGRKLEAAFGGCIRFLGIGGASLARDVEVFLHAAGFPYAIGYGLTETAPLVAAAVPYKTWIGSTGRPLDGVKVRIMPPADAHDAGTVSALAGDAEGEIQVLGPNVMLGYYKDDARTAEVFTADGWFRTGDLGAWDSRGLLHVKGRLKAMILGPSGENIYPEEIESTLASSGLVEESLVYAAKDGTLVAMVVLNERAKALLGDAIAAVSDARSAVVDAVRDASGAVRDASRGAAQ